MQSSEVCDYTQMLPSAADLPQVRQATLCLINKERAAADEAALQPNGLLARAAQEHSEAMAQDEYFAHSGPGGDVLERLEAVGYISNSEQQYEVGENIAYGTLADSTPAAIVAAWMASPMHRDNLLNPGFRETGIGIWPHVPSVFGAGQSGALYTQDFGAIG